MRRRLLAFASAAALAVGGLVGIAATEAGAASSCDGGSFPAATSIHSNFNLRCIIESADSDNEMRLHDFSFAQYHRGAARTVSVQVNSGSGGQLIGASGTFSAADVNRTVTATGIQADGTLKPTTNQECADIKARTFIKSVTGTTIANLSVAPGKDTDNTRTATISVYSGQKLAAATASVFNTCDAQREITGTGIPAGTKITKYVNPNLVVLSAAATSTSTSTKTIKTKNLNIQITNSTSRSVTDAATTAASTTVTSATANFKTGAVSAGGDVGATVSSTCLPAGTTISSVSSATTIVVSAPATCTSSSTPAGKTLSIGGDPTQSSARAITDAVRVNAGDHITSATANFQNSDIGLPIVIGSTTYTVVTRVSSSDVTVTPAITADAPATNAIIGIPSGTAPLQADVVIQGANYINLDPTFVPGSDPCTDGTYEGTTVSGRWYNPGFFQAAAFGGSTPPASASPAIAQLAFPTSVVTFAAYVTPEGTDSVVTGNHYDIVFPNLPTGIAVCPGTTQASNWRVLGSSSGTQIYPSGWGQPDTAAVRYIQLASDTSSVAGLTLDETGTPTDLPTSSCTAKASFTVLASAFTQCGY
jgi:hypothetical protein